MRPPRRSRRTLSDGELRLWGEIAKLVTPLRGKALPARPARPVETAPGIARPAGKPAASPVPAKPATIPLAGALGPRPVKLGDLAPPLPKPSAPAFRPPPPLSAGLERKERRGLQRGSLEIEARIDLHGLYQAEAHAALIGFITRARAAGHARVLVVTGKGGGPSDFDNERGVLRRSVPHWLRGADLRGLVLGFEEAGRRHGGAGALYVRLKRR